VKLEQAPKGQSWMPTPPIFGEGCSGVEKQPSTATALIHRGNEDGMSRRWLAYRGRSAPEAESRPATAYQVSIRAGVGEGRTTVEAG
jgi:hypothetical protein